MNSILELESNIRQTTDYLKDMVELASLNLQALDLTIKPKHNTLTSEFQTIRAQFKLCQQFRLQYLIKNQIILQGDIERRDRMKDYEDKIQLNRRLMTDKETNYLQVFKKKSMKSFYQSPADAMVVQMGKRKKQKQLNTLLYQNELSVFNVIRKKHEKQQQKLFNQLQRIKEYENQLIRLECCKQNIENKAEEYLKYLNINIENIKDKHQHEVQCKQQTSNVSSNKCNDLILDYLRKSSNTKKQNQQLMVRLKAKISYTTILQQQNLILQNKLQNNKQQDIQKQFTKQKQEHTFVNKNILLTNLTSRF